MTAIRFCFSLFCLMVWNPGRAQHPVGIFEDNLDIGHPKLAGSAGYDEASQTYNLTGAGSNIWFNRDEFHFVYKKIKGDFTLTADFAFTGDTVGAVGHRKIGWMIRESVDEAAASANSCKHIDGLVVLQWRPYRGMFMRDPEEERFYPKQGGPDDPIGADREKSSPCVSRIRASLCSLWVPVNRMCWAGKYLPGSISYHMTPIPWPVRRCGMCGSTGR